MKSINFDFNFDLDLIDFIRSGYLLTAAAILAVSQIPFLQGLIAYGARASDAIPVKEKEEKRKKQTKEQTDELNEDASEDDDDDDAIQVTTTLTSPSPPSPSPSNNSPLQSLVSFLASYSVPHTYFTHFYVLSCLSSLLWAHQLYFRGPLFTFLARLAQRRGKDLALDADASVTLNQLLLCWIVLTCQGARRLAECIIFFKPSASRMWIVHYLVGIAFYVTVNIAIWIEGVGTLTNPTTTPFTFTPFIPLTNLFPVTAIILASGIQHDCHHYLSSLPKYTLPTEHVAFLNIISPHYTAECIIYLSLAFLAAPQGQVVNKTVLSAAVFVVINLGVSAGNSKRWYEKKFGAEGVKGRWRMVPGIY